MALATVRVPGSCGELVQGSINGEYLLITCPINCYSEVTVTLDTKRAVPLNDRQRSKAHLAVRRTLRHFQTARHNYHLAVSSVLPIGKGMASSSADVGAACLATAACLGRTMSCEQIAAIALSIEPTDAVFCPGIVMFDYRAGKICEFLGEPPAIELLIFDVGGKVDTVLFNARPDLAEKNRRKEHIIKDAVALIKKGMRTGNPAFVGQGATLSALANQSILPKKHLEEVIHWAQQSGALGVNIAHSGTVVGVLLDAQSTGDRNFLITEICRRWSWAFLRRARIIGGGGQIVTVKEPGTGIKWRKERRSV